MKTSGALIGFAMILFASSNVDDIIVLVGLFADPKFRVRHIVLGQYAGIAVLFTVSLLGALLSFAIPASYVGLFGFAPILIGLKKLWNLYRDRSYVEENEEPRRSADGWGPTATVALLTIANGGDNIGLYLPSFASRSGYEIGVVGFVFVLLTALWCLLAHWIVHHPKLGAPIQRSGSRIAPVAFIGLGVSILYRAGSFGLFSR